MSLAINQVAIGLLGYQKDYGDYMAIRLYVDFSIFFSTFNN